MSLTLQLVPANDAAPDARDTALAAAPLSVRHIGFGRTRIETGCLLEIEHSQESLHAHVSLDYDANIGPGDKVKVQGAPVRMLFGSRLTERRLAVITKANPIERWITRWLAQFQLTELYEVSFSPAHDMTPLGKRGYRQPPFIVTR